jgi:hypothetical protein
MKIKQIAIATNQIEEVEKFLELIFDCDFSMSDKFEMRGNFDGVEFEDVSTKLKFDFNILDGCDEFELIEVDRSKHWHGKIEQKCFISHFGVYCESREEINNAIGKLTLLGFEIIQDSISKHHLRKNKDNTERSYRDIVFNTSNSIGFNIKLSLKLGA